MDYSKLAKEIKEKIDIVDIVSFYVKDIKKRGRNFVALCPFHSERTPSFTISREKQIFYCFGCNTGGDVITFVSKIENISIHQALKKLATIAGITIEIDDVVPETQQDKEKKLMKQINMEAATIYNTLIRSSDGKKARDFLAEKGIKEQSILNFLLGYAPKDESFLYDQLAKKYPKEILMKTSLFSFSLGRITDLFRDRIIIPIRSLSGDVIGFGARTLSDEQPKYLNSQENQIFHKRKNLFGLFNSINYLRKERKAIIVEGYFDVIMMHQYLFPITISTMGTSFTAEQAHLLKNIVDEVIFMYDSDKAGINAALKAADIAVEEGLYPKIVLLDENTDPDEFLLKNGADSMIELITSAKDIVSFKIDLIKKKHKNMTPENKVKAIEFLSETIIKEKNEIIKMEWIKKVSEAFEVDESAVKTTIENKKTRESKTIQRIKVASIQKPQIPLIEENLLEMVFKNPQIINLIKESNFDISYLESEFTKIILSFLIENPAVNPIEDILIDRFPQYHTQIIKISLNSQNIDENTLNSENIKKTLTIIEKNYLERELKKIKQSNDFSDDTIKKINDLIMRLKNLKI